MRGFKRRSSGGEKPVHHVAPYGLAARQNRQLPNAGCPKNEGRPPIWRPPLVSSRTCPAVTPRPSAHGARGPACFPGSAAAGPDGEDGDGKKPSCAVRQLPRRFGRGDCRPYARPRPIADGERRRPGAVRVSPGVPLPVLVPPHRKAQRHCRGSLFTRWINTWPAMR